jgi:hypothetical protein
MNQSLNIALKEWAVVCRALKTGRQIMLLRKGGIHESSAGFELEHMQFLLFPTYLHQNLQMLKPEAHAEFEDHSAEPATIRRHPGVASVTLVRGKKLIVQGIDFSGTRARWNEYRRVATVTGHCAARRACLVRDLPATRSRPPIPTNTAKILRSQKKSRNVPLIKGDIPAFLEMRHIFGYFPVKCGNVCLAANKGDIPA